MEDIKNVELNDNFDEVYNIEQEESENVQLKIDPSTIFEHSKIFSGFCTTY